VAGVLDESVLLALLERGELVFAKNSWLSGKNVERAKRIGITPKKKVYIRRNAPWSKARRYKNAMSLKQRARTILFKLAVSEVKDATGINDPAEAVRVAFGERAPRAAVSRAKPAAVLRAEALEELSKLPKEVQDMVNRELATIRERIARYKAQAGAGEVKETPGVNGPAEAVRTAFGERAPRAPKSRAKPTAVLRAEIEDELKKLPPEARKLFEEKMAAVRARIEAYKRQATGG
jgi:mRNA-degrading endonuclease RelE of RelBE toxin-antitoxin system